MDGSKHTQCGCCAPFDLEVLIRVRVRCPPSVLLPNDDRVAVLVRLREYVEVVGVVRHVRARIVFVLMSVNRALPPLGELLAVCGKVTLVLLLLGFLPLRM